MSDFQYYVPTKVYFGNGSLEKLATMDLPGKKAMICMTEGVRQYAGKIVELLEQNGVSTVIFDQVQPNPNSTGVMKAVALAQENGVDFLIGLGGGSSVDTAKAAAEVMANGADVWEYMGGMTGKLKPVKRALPVVAISTTSGTGTEVNPFAVITKEETCEKIDLSSEAVYPAISIIDPTLQMTVPAALTACQGMDVLDCFTHTGSFALNAGIAGAKSVLGIDASQLAVDQATENAKLNGLQEVVKFQCEDVFALLPRLEAEGRKFDVIILDPPAFTKSRSSVKNAVKGYREINLRAMKLLKDGGFLATCSCSHFMTYELFTQTIGQAAKNVHKRLRQVEYRHQAPDHPILWAAEESYYLKFYIFQVMNQP